MRVEIFSDVIPDKINQDLLAFEKSFRYFLGSTQFYINHGPDYARFYKALGPSYCFVCFDSKNAITGVVSASIIEILFPENLLKKVVYFGDLKISDTIMKGRVLYHLFFAVVDHFKNLNLSSGLGVVMAGTQKTPLDYTGRLGFPQFSFLSDQIILRVETKKSQEDIESQELEPDKAWRLYHNLKEGLKPLLPSHSDMRSLIKPIWISHENTAVALIEDTRRAKKLYTVDGTEIISAHLSYLATKNEASTIKILHLASMKAHQLGFTHLFVTLSKKTYEEIRSKIPLNFKDTSAQLYSTNKLLHNYLVNSADI